MADARVTFGRRSRAPGTDVGINVNTFGAERLLSVLTGAQLEPILHEAMVPAYEQLKQDWPILTGASSDTIRIETQEVGVRHVRVALKIGGELLVSDARNVKHIDYAPFVEFNGTSKTPPGTMAYAMHANQAQIRQTIHEMIGQVIQSALAK